jgi:hypothetical protein
MACRAEARPSEGWSTWQDLHLQPSRLERDASAYWATRGWLAEPKLGAKVGAHGRICTDTLRVLSAPSLHWTTWALRIRNGDCGVRNERTLTTMVPLFLPHSAIRTPHLRWCRVREFHPQPLRPERSASGNWANAAKMALPAGISPSFALGSGGAGLQPGGSKPPAVIV